MKLVGVISTAILSLTLGAAAPMYAQQDQHDPQEEQKAKPAQDEKKAEPTKPAQDEKKAEPTKPAKQEEKGTNAKPEEKSTQQENNNKPEEKNAKQPQQEAKPGEQAQRAGGNSRGIPADRYKANFGSGHTFRVNQGDYNNHSFQYGGYSFGFVGVWPSNWLYTQNVYVVDIDGVYYLCNPMYPGVNIALIVNL
jgi:type IV secretory pathway VirB10-like protein